MKPPLTAVLSSAEISASRYFVSRILDEVRAPLAHALLFGSRARRQAREDSDIDILLIFDSLPPSREPFAGEAEAIAAEVAGATGVPLSVWSVSLGDLEEGSRTPMLVDAMEDGFSIWSCREPPPAVAFTPADALRCTSSLLERVAEGGVEFVEALGSGEHEKALTRARDDLVRLCTCLLLLKGITRPRRAEAIGAVQKAGLLGGKVRRPLAMALVWAESAFGDDGRAEIATSSPLVSPPELAAVIDELRDLVIREASMQSHDQSRNITNRAG